MGLFHGKGGDPTPEGRASLALLPVAWVCQAPAPSVLCLTPGPLPPALLQPG